MTGKNVLLGLLILGFACLACSKRISHRHHRAKDDTKPVVAQPESVAESKAGLKVCEGWWCGHGKECRAGPAGMPECICIQECPKPKRGGSSVCGSDGKFYETHCQLHRTACLTNTQLTIDRSNTCQVNRKDSDEDEEERDDAEEDLTESEINANDKKYSGYRKSSAKIAAKDSRRAPVSGDKPEESEYKGASSGWVLEPSPVQQTKKTKLFQSTSDEDSFEDEFEEDEDDAEEDEEDSPQVFSSSAERRRAVLEREIKKADSSSSLCSPQEYEILKDNLLLYSHERLIGGVQSFKKALESENDRDRRGSGGAEEESNEASRWEKRRSHSHSQQQPAHQHGTPNKLFFDEALGDGPEAGKDYLLSLMFSHFDQNNNGALEYDELRKVGAEKNLGKLAPGCNLVDLLRYDDSDRNDQLNINEFYTAFNKLYSVSVISLDKALEVTRVTGNVGESLELKCDVSGSPPMPIVWKRYGLDLATLNQDDQVRVFADGTLFLSKIQLLHAGNYSCQAQRNDKVVQTHILTVRTLPDVKVTPHIVWEKPGAEVTMECRVMGEPFPVVQWLKNDDPLPSELSDKYIVTGDAIRLTLKDIYFSDTGAYMCQAENSAGKRLDITSLVVIDEQTPSSAQTNESQFFVFHELGISVYDPTNCRIQHQIQATDIIPGTQEYVCGEHEHNTCDWGRAIRVSSTYVYVSQPNMDRILVISVSQWTVVDVVSTDRYPVNLDYVPHLDQVWVQCWRQDEPGSQKTLQVIRDAKEKKKHHTVHPEPIDSHFDLVENLFLPPDLKSSSQFRYGYVSHKNARGLYKMDLVGLRYVKSLDLTPYNCFPQHVQFSALYGMIIVECYEPVTMKHSGQLVLDAMTDSVVYFKGDRFGRPYLSPDSRKLVTVSHSSDGTTLLLQLVKETGLEFFFDVKTSLNVSDVSFFPSQRSHTYDLYASAVDKEDVLFVDLESGKVEMVSGVGESLHTSPWKSAQRPISSQGLFSSYLATPAKDSVFVLNGQSHTVNCQIGGLSKPHLIVWLEK